MAFAHNPFGRFARHTLPGRTLPSVETGASLVPGFLPKLLGRVLRAATEAFGKFSRPDALSETFDNHCRSIPDADAPALLHIDPLSGLEAGEHADTAKVTQRHLQNLTTYSLPDDPVAVAARYARRLAEAEARRSCVTLTAAYRSVARRLRTSPSAIYGLLFRRPKNISADLFFALQAAVERDLQREIETLEQELTTIGRRARLIDPATVEDIDAGIAALKSKLRAGL